MGAEWILALAGGRVPFLDLSSIFVRVCVLIRKARRRRLTEDEIKVSPPSPRLRRRRRRRRLIKDGDGGGSGDRLSVLPDDLLRAILLRLKALQTVRTCVLSTRWRHLWRCVPCLDIDMDEPEFDYQCELNSFMTNLLRSHEFTLVEDFRLRGADVVIGDRLLRQCGQDTWPRRLKRLHLSSLRLELNDLACHMSSSGCPALEEVQLEKCVFFTTSNPKIVSSSLKKLVVDGEYRVYDDEIFRLIIEAPSLVSLRLGEVLDHIVDTTEPHHLPSLVDASIHLYWIEDDVTQQLGIFGVLSNVTTLHLLHSEVTLLFYENHQDLPVFKFENLRTLFLDECRISDDFLGVQQYLWNLRNLHKLTLRHCMVSDFQPTKEVMERRRSYYKDLVHFKCNNLRLSKLIYRDGDDHVHLLVKGLVGMWRNLPNNKIELTALKKKEHDQIH
ncbi:hypothetical protein VPH35_101813 [Triticum aestivum]